MSAVLQDFGYRLKEARIRAGYRTARDFALALGVEPPAYRYWERNQAKPDLQTFSRLCLLLNVDPNTFLEVPTREHHAA